MSELKPEELNFEGAMERLEEIVEAMESGSLPLEEMLERYEEGNRMVKLCSEKLAVAEKRIEIITRNAAGKPQAEEFEPSNSPVDAPEPTVRKSARTASSKAAPPKDDVSLF